MSVLLRWSYICLEYIMPCVSCCEIQHCPRRIFLIKSGNEPSSTDELMLIFKLIDMNPPVCFWGSGQCIDRVLTRWHLAAVLLSYVNSQHHLHKPSL